MDNITSTPEAPLVSIIIPAYNEESNLPELRRRLLAALDPAKNYHFEFIIIDNCSEDATGAVAHSFVVEDERWKYIRFSRNFGVEGSMNAGLHYSSGDALIFLFSDLQEPPEVIPEMLEKWSEGYDVVYGVLRKRHDYHWVKSVGAWVAYRLIHFLSDVKIPPNATDYRLLSRPVIEALKRTGEQNRYMRGLVFWTGFKHTTFQYDRAPRMHGKTTANILFSIGFALRALVAFTTKPLKIASIVGASITSLSILGAFVYLMLKILTNFGVLNFTPPPPGWTTLTLLILFFGGLQILFLGIIGEYLAHTYNEVKNRPLWIVRESAGFPYDKDPVKSGRTFI